MTDTRVFAYSQELALRLYANVPLGAYSCIARRGYGGLAHAQSEHATNRERLRVDSGRSDATPRLEARWEAWRRRPAPLASTRCCARCRAS